MAHDPEVVRSAIEHLRKELRGRTGSRMTSPSQDGGDGPGEGAHVPPESEEAHEPPEEAKAEGDVTCPKCGATFSPHEEDGHDGAPPAHDGAPPAGGDGHPALLLIPKHGAHGGGKHGL